MELFLYNKFLEHIKIDPNRTITDFVMFDRDLNIQICDELMKINYIKLTVLRGVQHSVSLFSMIFPKYQFGFR